MKSIFKFSQLAIAAVAELEFQSNYDFNGNHRCFDTDTFEQVHNQMCCDAGLDPDVSCPTYTFDGSVCSVVPYDVSAREFQYGTELDDCCMGAKNDDSLTAACTDFTTETMTIQEVFETVSRTCDNVYWDRLIYTTSTGEIGAITYEAPHFDSTELRCCLEMDDWHENPNACTQGEPENYSEYNFDEGSGVCTQTDFTRVDLLAPGSGARVVVVSEGEPMITSGPTEVDNAVCCENIQEGCDSVVPGPDKPIDGEYDPETMTCVLTAVQTTNFLDEDQNVVYTEDGEQITLTDQDKATCCAAGVALKDEGLIQACVEEKGLPEEEFEFDDLETCIKRTSQTFHYVNDGEVLTEYGTYDELLFSSIVNRDECCMFACDNIEDLQIQKMLKACSSIDTEHLGTRYRAHNTEERCIRGEQKLDTYMYSDDSFACELHYTTTYLSDFGEVELEECCANADEQIEFQEYTDDPIPFLNLYCHEDENFSEGSELEFNENDGVCKMVDGDIFNEWRNHEQELIRSSDPVDHSGEEVQKRHCCRAYMEGGEINNSLELLYACEELDFEESEYTYDEEEEVCTVETTSFTYTDQNVDEMYTEEDDGDYFNFMMTTSDDDRDPCCQNAEGDLQLLQSCENIIIDDDDEFFTFEEPGICKRQYDRKTTY